MTSRNILAAGVAFALLLERYHESYAATWILGSTAGIILLWRGAQQTRVVLAILLGIIVLPGVNWYEGLRYWVFFSLFAACAEFLRLSVNVHLAMQAGFLATAIYFDAASPERFTFGVSILLLIKTLVAVRRLPQGTALLQRATGILYAFLSLATAIIGFGTRSAIFVWVVALGRRKLLLAAGVSLVVIFASLSFPNLPVVSKINNALAELVEPIDQETGAVNLRAVENGLFVDHLARASAVEYLLGSRIPLVLPGELLGLWDEDVRFIPHNMAIGVFYQFGLVGFLVIGYFFSLVYERLKPSEIATTVYIGLLAPMILMKAGFLDTDFGLITATLFWIVDESQ